ncbi:MAG: hypothetical protein LUC92_02480 [Clostridiales bacterium]|nr:hypothetical protein [Clostridiales bacterium]
MKIFKASEKILKASAVLCLAFLTACGGGKGVTTSTGSENSDNTDNTDNAPAIVETTTEEYSKAEDEYIGEAGVDLSLPGGQWDITLDNERCTRLEQGDKTITVSILDEVNGFDSSTLPQSAEEAASRFTSTDALADVLDYSLESYDDGTSLLSYTVKYKSGEDTVTLTTSTRVLDEHKAVVVDGIIRQDADDAEIEMMKNAVSTAMIDKIKDIEE